MVCACYADPRLAALYDAMNPPGPDTDFYLALAGDAPLRVLDVGCGTGLLACEFAARGHRVTGADPAPAMLDIARRRPGGGAVRWIEADAASLPAAGLPAGAADLPAAGLPPAAGPPAAADLPSAGQFDLVVMTGHVFQLFLGDGDVRAALRGVRRCLAPGGRFAFETRNPAARAWEAWNPWDTREHVTAGRVAADIWYDIESVDGELVTFETCYRFARGETITVPDTLRFTGQGQLAAFLAEAGLDQVTWYGDWDATPAGPASPELIAVARSSAAHPSDRPR